MNCLICSDKFKGSISAQDACDAIQQGLELNYPNYNYQCLPLADGGDGSLAVIANYVDGTYIDVPSVDPLHRPINAQYLLSGTTAYIELATASGIARLSSDEKSPMYTDTRGTGILIKDALNKGANHIVLMLGGSCSTDAGLGIIQALGYRILDDDDHHVPPQGAYLSDVSKISAPDKLLPFTIQVLCDVTNPLYGPKGAAHVFAPQKGATEEEIEILDRGLMNISKVIYAQSGVKVSKIEGGGSAGGIAAGLHGILGASIESGFDVLSNIAQLPAAIEHADIVITGEGQLDLTSLEGKVVGMVAQSCLSSNTPVIAIVGKNELKDNEIKNSQLREVHAIYPAIEDISDAISNAKFHIAKIASCIKL